MKSKRFEIRLSEQDRKTLEDLAKAMKKPKSKIIHSAIQQYLMTPSVKMRLYGQADIFELQESSPGEAEQTSSKQGKYHGNTSD